MNPVAGLSPRTVVCLAIAPFGIAYGMTAPILSLALHARGVSPALIGLNAGMYALGALGTALLLGNAVRRWGSWRLLSAALAAVALVLGGFVASPWLWLWYPLRWLLGAASEVVMVTTEAWMGQQASAASRGRDIAMYTASLSAGLAIGPAVVALFDEAIGRSLGLASVLALACWGMLALSRRRPPRFEEGPAIKVHQALRLAPGALVVAALNGAVEALGMSLLPIYAAHHGWTPAAASALLAVLMCGAIVLQLPIGWLGDRLGRGRVLGGLLALSCLGALAWTQAIGSQPLAFVLVFFWGGAFVGVYALSVAQVGDRYSGAALIGLYGAMSIAWSLGAFAGPVLGGLALAVHTEGLPVSVALACALAGLLLLWARQPRAGAPSGA